MQTFIYGIANWWIVDKAHTGKIRFNERQVFGVWAVRQLGARLVNENELGVDVSLAERDDVHHEKSDAVGCRAQHPTSQWLDPRIPALTR